MSSVKRLRSFTAGEKLKVIREAEEIGNRAAGRKYSISESCVRDWRKKKEILKSSNKNRRAFRSGIRKFPQVEEQLSSYIQDRRQHGFAISTEIAQLKAAQIAKELQIPNEDFKASRGWLRRFMNRNGLSIRKRTSICQRLPDAYEEKLLAFQRYVIRLREENNFSMGQIGNADETPVYFDMPADSTINAVGDKSVRVRTCGYEKQRCTVMLTVLADGKKLAPFIIFKRKTLPKGEKFPAGVIVRCQEKGWMDNALVLDWVKCVWERRPGALLKLKNMLVLDSFRGHMTDDVKKKLQEGKTEQVCIPGGMTSLLQPLDVCINRPFKAHLKHFYLEWMATTVHETTPTGRLKKPTLTLICDWILAAWNLIPNDLVAKSFKKCCISNSLDGNDDSAVWDDNDDDVPSAEEGSSSDED